MWEASQSKDGQLTLSNQVLLLARSILHLSSMFLVQVLPSIVRTHRLECGGVGVLRRVVVGMRVPCVHPNSLLAIFTR